MVMTGVLDKRADLAGPGIGNYEELEKALPNDYTPVLDPKETQRAITAVKRFIEDGLCRELNLMRVEVPLIVDAESGVNDYLDRDGSRGPIGFHISNDNGKNPIDAQVVQAATKWKRMALAQFGMKPGEGLVTDMRAVRKDYFLDHDHSAYVDQWDWEKAITPHERSLEYLTKTVEAIWKVIKGAEYLALNLFPALAAQKIPRLPEKLTFLHAEDLLDMYPDLPRKQRETAILQEAPAVFIYGIGWTLKDGYPHEMRAADYDDWVTQTHSKDGRPMHGLNGDILVWNPVTKRRHELSSMGIRVNAETLQEAARADEPAPFPEVPLSPGNRQRHAPALHRRRHRTVAHADAAPPQGPPGRGERDGVAEGPEGDVREAQHPRHRVTGAKEETVPGLSRFRIRLF